MHPLTLEGCRKRWTPLVSDWLPYEQWTENGSENAFQKASTQFKEILEKAPESILDSAIDHELFKFIKNANT